MAAQAKSRSMSTARLLQKLPGRVGLLGLCSASMFADEEVCEIHKVFERDECERQICENLEKLWPDHRTVTLTCVPPLDIIKHILPFFLSPTLGLHQKGEAHRLTGILFNPI